LSSLGHLGEGEKHTFEGGKGEERTEHGIPCQGLEDCAIIFRERSLSILAQGTRNLNEQKGYFNCPVIQPTDLSDKISRRKRPGRLDYCALFIFGEYQGHSDKTDQNIRTFLL
jgi:hypothetical protein